MSKKMIDKKSKIKVADIICYVCAAMFCAIPFIPFVDEMDTTVVVTKKGELDVAAVVVSHLVLSYTWYAYFTIVIAALIVAALIIKKNSIRIIMLVAVFAETMVLVVRANQLVMKIFTGGLYEPTVGYYMLLVASSVVIIVTLFTMMKEKNASTVKQDEPVKEKLDEKQ